MKNLTKISVERASEILGISKESVRSGMRKGELPIGYIKKHPHRHTYYIYEEMIKESIKQKSPQNEDVVDSQP